MCKCFFCNSSQNIQLFQSTDTSGNLHYFHRCENCKTVFPFPPSIKDVIDAGYTPEYYGVDDSKFNSAIVDFFINISNQKKAKFLSRFLNNNDKILDIGCGNGFFLKCLLKHGVYELYGTERSKFSVERANKLSGMKVFQDLNVFEDNYFDAITLFHVFEHLEKPARLINIINNLLKPNGILIISFPNINSIQAKIFKGHWFHLDQPRHLFFPDIVYFKTYMSNSGFKLIKSRYFCFEQNTFGLGQSILNVFLKKRDVLFERLKGNKQYAPQYKRFNVFLQKLFFISIVIHLSIIDIVESMIKRNATIELTFKKLK